MEVVCEFCARSVRKSERKRHYVTHAETWSHTASHDIKQYCLVNKKPLMFLNNSGKVPWVICLGCEDFRDTNTKQFCVNHRNDCNFKKYKHLYEVPLSFENDMTSLENEVLKENLKILKSKLKGIVTHRISDLRNQLYVANMYKDELAELDRVF